MNQPIQPVQTLAPTASVKEELSRLDIRKPSVCKAEVSTMLRFAGGLHIFSGLPMIQAEVDLESTASRLRTAIAEFYGCQSQILSVPGRRARPHSHYIIRVVQNSEALARQTGLLDSRGNPVRGLPSAIVNGSLSDVEAVWRGAFLAQGSLSAPGRTSSLGITCPRPEAALALIGAARRLGVEAKIREVRGVDTVIIRDHSAIVALLARMGADSSLAKWEEQRRHKDVKAAPANWLVDFHSSNRHRTVLAAATVSARVERALEILGNDVSDHLKCAGELRIAHKQASLEKLGQLADPPTTKDAIAGRLRRLLAQADSRASELGISGTETFTN